MPSSEGRSRKGKSRRTVGSEFEQRAAQHYISLGFEILETNWQAGHREIDLIARKGNLVAFIEVKSDSTGKFGHPAERVDKTKIKHLSEAAQQYIIENKIEGVDLRFDVVTFQQGRLELYPSAFDSQS